MTVLSLLAGLFVGHLLGLGALYLIDAMRERADRARWKALVLERPQGQIRAGTNLTQIFRKPHP